MRIFLRIDSVRAIGTAARNAGDYWLWPVFFVVDDRLIGSAFTGMPADEAVIDVLDPVRLNGPSHRPTSPGPTASTFALRQPPIALWSTDVTVETMPRERAEVGFALLLATGNRDDPASAHAVRNFVAQLRCVVTHHVASALGLDGALEPGPKQNSTAEPLGDLKCGAPHATLSQWATQAQWGDNAHTVRRLTGLARLMAEPPHAALSDSTADSLANALARAPTRAPTTTREPKPVADSLVASALHSWKLATFQLGVPQRFQRSMIAPLLRRASLQVRGSAVVDAAASRTPAIYIHPSGRSRVLLAADDRGAVHEFMRGTGSSLRRSNLQALAGMVPASGSISAAVTGDATEYATYRGNQQRIHLIQRTGNGLWCAVQASNRQRLPLALHDPTIVEWPALTQVAIVYAASQGRLILLRPAAGSHWKAHPVGNTAAAASRPAVCVDPSDRSLHLVYRSRDGALHHSWTDHHAIWQHKPVAIPPALDDIASVGPVQALRGGLQLLVRTCAGHIAWWRHRPDQVAPAQPAQHRSEKGHKGPAASGQSRADRAQTTDRILILDERAGAPLAAGDPVMLLQAVDRGTRVLYRGVDGHIHDLRRDRTQWVWTDLTRATGTRSALGDPHLVSWPQQRSILAVWIDRRGHLIEATWETTREAAGRARAGWKTLDLSELVATRGRPTARRMTNDRIA